MTTSGQLARNTGTASTIAHNPETTAQFMQEITRTRLCKLRMRHSRDKNFTVEQLIKDVQYRCSFRANTSLNGSLGRLARGKSLIKDIGPWVEAEREERHANKVPLCGWIKDGVELVTALPMERFLKDEKKA